ncbi:MAG: hypothetical protein KDD73_00510 [Anaerolineales bacterium]|nr:hypothetical protein [Anaerolineales bacterium]MCB9128392.1 phage tail assembly protein [Ardenticatenales bacterium]
MSESNHLQTDFAFTLPKGYVDTKGTRHREGKMRLATAMDEIAPLRDPRVRDNEAYLTILILARVVTQLGSLVEINTNTIEKLFTADLAYLQEVYHQINFGTVGTQQVTCPNCDATFEVGPVPLGE